MEKSGYFHSILCGNKLLAPLYDVISTTVYTGLTDKLSIKIGKHYEIKKVTEDDFAILSQSLGIKDSVIPGIFADFSKKIAVCTKKLEADERIDKELLRLILSGVGERVSLAGGLTKQVNFVAQ